MYEGEKPTEMPAFGNTAASYAAHRLGFPVSMYERLLRKGVIKPHTKHLDMGTGTGTFARSAAKSGLEVSALDIDAAMLREATSLSASEGLTITYKQAPSEQTGETADTFDSVSAGQCWHWFDGPAAAREAKRILKPGGRLLICYYDWIPTKGNLVAASEQLILKHNPDWKAAGGTGIYARWFQHLGEAGFENIESFSYDEPALYNRSAWIGRLEASAGIAILPPQAREAFKAELREMLAAAEGDDPLSFAHRVFCLWGQKKPNHSSGSV